MAAQLAAVQRVPQPAALVGGRLRLLQRADVETRVVAAVQFLLQEIRQLFLQRFAEDGQQMERPSQRAQVESRQLGAVMLRNDSGSWHLDSR